MQVIIELYRATYGEAPSNVAALAKAGSNRKYYRLTSGQGASVIGVIGTSQSENAAFVYLSQHFKVCGLNVPEIIAVNEDTCCYLQTDLGSSSLYEALAEGRTTGTYSEAHMNLLRATIKQLARMQMQGDVNLDYEKLLPPVVFNAEAAMFDLNYFKYCFLKTTDVPFDEVSLERDMQEFAKSLVSLGQMSASGFLYRDFQARNVMLVHGEPFFIDFQGGMKGPVHYDVASFLWQASAKYSDEMRSQLIEEYLDELQRFVLVDRSKFKQQLLEFVLFRTLQVLGAYGLRGYFERKEYFIKSIPQAILNLKQLLDAGVVKKYPYMERVLKMLVELKCGEVLGSKGQCGEEKTKQPAMVIPKLKVRVYSFSYKKSGIPCDESGNGGGYVFDCRSTHNPGRYEPYKKLTGLDASVIEFLENDGEIFEFLKPIYTLAEAHVERYIQRDFTDLMFSFGCTGGQHRSVYSAQHLAEHLHRKYNIHVVVNHLEQGIVQELLPLKK